MTTIFAANGRLYGSAMIDVEELLRGSPVYYKDGEIEMRLVLLTKPINAVCLEWKCKDEWVEVSSMRTAAFNAILDRYLEKQNEEIK